MKRLLISVILAIALAIVPASGVLAGTTATVTVTAVPSYIDISIDNTEWLLNGISGSGVLDIGTTYYSKASGSETEMFSDPVTDAECWHTVTNSSTVSITLKADMADFTGGATPMTNGDGTAGASAFAAWVSESGSSWSSDKVVMNALHLPS